MTIKEGIAADGFDFLPSLTGSRFSSEPFSRWRPLSSDANPDTVARVMSCALLLHCSTSFGNSLYRFRRS
jgi:hypothetical protein